MQLLSKLWPLLKAVMVSLFLLQAYEAHCAANGQPPSHQFMKELLAGFAAAEVDKLFETKGLNWLDRERAKQHAIQQAHQLAEERYGAGNVGGYTGQFGQPYGGNQYGGVPSGYGGGNPYGGNAYGGNPYGGNPIPSGY
jgi:hypothetical protein